jgi:hypothetical protein
MGDDPDPIEILTAERAIQAVLTQYARGVDRCDESLLRDCYWPDATDDHGDYKGSGHGFASWVVALLSKVFSSTQHAISNTRIECTLADDLARVESYVVARHVTRSDPPELVEAGARYLDRFSRRDGRWRIARRVCVIDWSRISRIETSFPAGEYQQGRRMPDDPSYSEDI